MATLLDTGLIGYVVPIFSFLLIYAVIYAILIKSKIFGENNVINSIIPLAVSVMFLLMPGAVDFVNFITPWFVVLVIVGFAVALLFLFLGANQDTVSGWMKNPTVYWTALIFGMIIIVAGLTHTFGNFFGQPDTGGGSIGSEVQFSIFNPKILATIFILIIATFAIKFISEEKM